MLGQCCLLSSQHGTYLSSFSAYKHTTICLHNHRLPTQRTLIIPRALHHDEASDAEDVSTSEPNRLESEIEANRAQVIVEPWHDRQQFLRKLEADRFGDGLRKEGIRCDHLWENALCTESGPLIKL